MVAFALDQICVSRVFAGGEDVCIMLSEPFFRAEFFAGKFAPRAVDFASSAITLAVRPSTAAAVRTPPRCRRARERKSTMCAAFAHVGMVGWSSGCCATRGAAPPCSHKHCMHGGRDGSDVFPRNFLPAPAGTFTGNRKAKLVKL